MKLWTICPDRTKWKSHWTLRRSDSMGNVLDKLEKQKGSILTLQEYPDGYLDQFADVFAKYAYKIDEYESYDNDDYDISSSDEHHYIRDIQASDMIVISDGRPVGHMIESKGYGGGMDNRSCTYGTILFFEKPNAEAGETYDTSYTVSDQSGRWSTRTTYTVIERGEKVTL